MRKKKIPYNIIRLRQGKYSHSLTHQIIAILNTKKTNSQAVLERFGYYKDDLKKILSVDFRLLGSYLNKGYRVNTLIKKLIFYYGSSYLFIKRKNKTTLRLLQKIKKQNVLKTINDKVKSSRKSKLFF